MLAGALLGAAVALRQISLHVIPRTPHYSAPFLGIHFYTWAFITFAVIFITASNMLNAFAECGPYECPGDPVSYWLVDNDSFRTLFL